VALMTGQHICLHVSIDISIGHYFHIRNNDSDGPLQFPNSDSDQSENSEQSHYSIGSEPLEFPSSDSDEPLHEGQLNRSPLSCMPTSCGKILTSDMLESIAVRFFVMEHNAKLCHLWTHP
jgi:predicted small lipoprotein YifL